MGLPKGDGEEFGEIGARDGGDGIEAKRDGWVVKGKGGQ